MRLLLVGDTHGSKSDMNKIFAHACRVEADRIIQLGDYGFGWHLKNFSGDQPGTVGRCDFSHHVAGLVAQTDIPLDWLDGNHENHTRLLTLPVDSDGYRPIWNRVRHIPRGTMLEYDGVRFLVCGGAISVDRQWRKLGTSYWPEEGVTPEDVAKCKALGAADVLLTHDAPLSSHVLDRHLNSQWPADVIHESYRNRTLIQEVWDNCGAKVAFHGHIHHPYLEHAENGLIVGLSKGDETIDRCTYLFDTEVYRSERSVHGYYDAMGVRELAEKAQAELRAVELEAARLLRVDNDF